MNPPARCKNIVISRLEYQISGILVRPSSKHDNCETVPVCEKPLKLGFLWSVGLENESIFLALPWFALTFRQSRKINQ